MKVQRTVIFNSMANTYTQCYFHLVFAVKNRNALVKMKWKNEMEMYITGIVQNHQHKMLAIGLMPNHIHILIGYNVNHLVPDLVEEIKTSSNNWIKGKRLSKFKFQWQIGYGAFTHSHSQIDQVVRYVLSQETHHKKKSFKDEYLGMLENNNVVYTNEYLFDFFDDIDLEN
jgi:putative transposase